jgi:hypothetical protein
LNTHVAHGSPFSQSISVVAQFQQAHNRIAAIVRSGPAGNRMNFLVEFAAEPAAAFPLTRSAEL